MKKITYVWAEDLDGWIGKDGSLPWHVKADMQHFKRVTADHPVVMGRRTFDSIGRPLPGRQNIVLTHREIEDKRVVSFQNLADLKKWIKENSAPVVDIIGGGRLFTELMPLVPVLHRTIINGHYEGDTKMPPVNYDQWHLQDRQTVTKDGQPVCWFEEWQLNVKEN